MANNCAAILVKGAFLWCLFLKTSIINGQSLTESPVQLQSWQDGKYWKLTNGQIGIILSRENTIRQAQPKKIPAPIQSLIYFDGTLSDDSPNYLSTETDPSSVKVTISKNTADECIIQYYYRFAKKQFVYGKKTFAGGEAGNGFYKAIIRLKKGAKSIMIEEETDYDIFYSIKISNGINPDKARYRGWSASSKEYGYEPSGKVYRPEHERGYPLDATIDLDYSKPVAYPKLVLWEPAGGENNSGRYWLLFNSGASVKGNITGFFQGRPSKLYAGKNAGPCLKITPAETINGIRSERSASIDVSIDRLSPDQSFATRKRFEWGIFISTQKDVLSPELTQPIALEMNRQSGISARVESYISKSARMVPAFYKGAIYLPEEKIQQLIKKIRTDNNFYEKVCSIDGLYKPVFDAWRFPDSARSLLNNILKWNRKLQKEYKIGEGSYEWDMRYWKGAVNFKYYALASSCLFADNTISISLADRKSIEQMLVLMARVVWDDDNTPMFDSSGINFGPENMVYMYQNNARYFFALIFATDPEFSARAKHVLQNVKKDLKNAVYANGSSFGNPHYTQATMDPLLFTMLQLKQAQVANLFTKNPLIYRFVDFFKSLLTPASPRFNGSRKLVSLGDGSEESAVTFGLLAAGLEDSDKEISNELYAVFENGGYRLSIYGPLSLTVDIINAHEGNPELGTSNYQGYMSHFRYNANTKNETAVWILNGDSLYDHRNDDAGETAIYALGAPLSLGRSSFYYPPATDARIKNVVVPFSAFPEWAGNGQPINERSLTNRTWPTSSQRSFAHLGNSSVSESLMQNEKRKWIRRVAIINTNPEQPVFIYYDSVTGSEYNIWNMFFSSDGIIKTPAGNIEPVKRVYDNINRKELPQGTSVKSLMPGWSTFQFNGQKWNRLFHTSEGINWNLSFFSTKQSEFSLSQWTTTWQNDTEAREFQKTNNRSYSDEQQILRLKTNQPVTAIICPYHKGTKINDQAIKEIKAGYHLLLQGKDSVIFTSYGYYSTAGATRTFAAIFLPGESFSFNNISMEGGPAEIEVTEKQVKIRVHGASGKRIIRLPIGPLKLAGSSSLVKSIERNGQTEITINYSNTTTNLLSNEKGFTEWIWNR